jgi:ATP-dependent DNA helicase RecG
VYGLLSGNYISQTRNKKIAAIFKEAQLIEKYESGIKRIEDEFVKYGLQTPLFENFQHGFRVTIYSKSSGKLEALLIEDPRATIPELANRLNITTRAH